MQTDKKSAERKRLEVMARAAAPWADLTDKHEDYLQGLIDGVLDRGSDADSEKIN